MATLSNVQVSVVRDIANAEAVVTFDIIWSAFDQATNLTYTVTWSLEDDDTGQDGDNLPLGDDPISMGIMFITQVSSNGQAMTSHTRNHTLAWSNLDKDAGDEEIRAVVTLRPQLPVETTRESTNFVLLTAP